MKTRADKLEKIIEYAVGNGYDFGVYGFKTEWLGTETQLRWLIQEYGDRHDNAVFEILFDHSFAKAFYGDYCGCLASDPGWRAHLQQQVLASDPLIYAWEYLQEVKDE